MEPDKERRALIGAHIARLVGTPEWDVYKGELTEMAQRVLEGLATATPEDIQLQQGILLGIRKVLQLPSTLMAQGRRH